MSVVGRLLLHGLYCILRPSARSAGCEDTTRRTRTIRTTINATSNNDGSDNDNANWTTINMTKK